MTRVILFDIDGTLILTGGAGQRAMARAFEELFAVSGALRHTVTPGRTDTAILLEIAAAHGIPPEDATLKRFPEVYLGYLREELPRPGPRKGLMPGVRSLLDALAARPAAHLALLTGNYERSAQAKLEYFDLWRYFRGGAFGDDAADRNALLPRALDAIRAAGGPEADSSDVVVIGDTPLDVACALAAGARSLAVATGDYDMETLKEAGADVVLRDLSQTEGVLDLLGLAD